jgi:hypothetical protein
MFNPNDLGFGVIAGSAGCDIIGANDPSQGSFTSLRLGVLAWTGPNYIVNVRKMEFHANIWGAYFVGSTGSEVSECRFDVPPQGYYWNEPIGDAAVGLVLHQSTNYIVEENHFEGMDDYNNVGIYFIGEVLAGNQIYNNEFYHLGVGTLVYGRHKGNDKVKRTTIGRQPLTKVI